MKQNFLKNFLICLFIFTGVAAFAYDCEVDGIYYNLNESDLTASVTYKTKSYSYSSDYRGVVNIPEKIVFYGIRYTVTSIGTEAFDYCADVTKVNIPNTVTTINNYAFYGCRGLTELTIPSSVISIGDGAFDECWELTELTIPNSVISIGSNVFANCKSLEKIVVEAENPKYDSREECNAIILTEENELILGCKNTFFVNTVTSIGDNAFYGCTGLAGINIPNNITSIGEEAFYNCSSLTSVISLNAIPPTIYSTTFDLKTRQTATLHVPEDSKVLYEQDEYWKSFYIIEEDMPNAIKATSANGLNETSIIYTLDGVKINATTTSDLPSGIYIVDGKKVVVK